MIAARNFRAACATMRQMSFAKMDLLLHVRTADFTADDDVEPRARAAVADCLVPTEPAAPTIVKRFNHLFSDPVGYAAGYYSYKWAEVLSVDAYSAFEEAAGDSGVLDARTGSRFLSEILAVGGSRPAIESFRAFRGRDPSIDALLRHQGIAVAA